MRPRGPLTMVILCLVPVVLWLAAPLPLRFADTSSTLASLAIVLGLVGLAAFALNVILGARLRVVSEFFGGLDSMYLAHRTNGRIVFWLVAGHALLMIASRWSISLDAVATMFSSGWEVPLGTLALLGLSIGLFLTLYARLGHEMFVYVQRTLGLMFVLGSLHVFLTPGVKAVSRPLTVYLGLLSAFAVGGYVYRSLFGNVLVRRHPYDVSRVNELDPHVVEVTMAPRGKPLRFVPGQFVYVTFYSDAFNAQFHPFSMQPEGESAVISIRPGDVRNQFHPFSITSADEERELRVTVKAVGDYTTAMHRLDERALARVEGPYGTFSYRNVDNRRQVWIAGGIGITPFLSMARSLRDDRYSIDLYYSMKSRPYAYFADELEAIAARRQDFDLRLFPEDEMGFLTAKRVANDIHDLDARDVFICGPPGMVDALSAQFVERGIPRARIHFERFAFGPS